MVDLGISNLDIYITGKCNYKCGYCYGENDKMPGMNISTYIKCLEFAHFINAKNIELCGGEPLVEPKFETYVMLAKDEGFDIILRTNAIFAINKISFIANNCAWVGISLDGLPRENSLMRESKYPISEDDQFNIPIKVIHKLKEKNADIKILLASVLCKKNYDSFMEFVNFVEKEKLPIDRWKIYQFVCDKFRSLENKNEYKLDDDKFDLISKKIPPHINDKTEVIIQSSKKLEKSTNCLIVRQNGDIILSNVFYGNVEKDPFDIIVDNLIEHDAIGLIVQNKNITYKE